MRTLRAIAIAGAATLSTVGCMASDARSADPSAIPVASLDSPGRCQVTGSDPDQELVRLKAACARALPSVARTWPDWTGTALVVVAEEDLDSGTAAYVEGFARDGEPSRGDRLVIAPDLSTDLNDDGLDIVFRHELTHLAMRSTGTAPLPLWATEGIAMHVGYAPVPGAHGEPRLELERLRSRVESGAWAQTVPEESLFEDSGHRSEAYAAAWLGIEVLIEDHGLDRVTDAMRARVPVGVEAPITDEDRTLHFLDSLGISRPSLEGRWRDELVRRTS